METEEQGFDFTKLLDNASDALVLVGVNGEIRYMNAHAERLFGYSSQELIGASVETLVPERFRQMHTMHRATYAREPRLRPMGANIPDLAYRRKDGVEFLAEINLAPLPEGLTVAAVRKRERGLSRPKSEYAALIGGIVIVIFIQLVINGVLYFFLSKP